MIEAVPAIPPQPAGSSSGDFPFNEMFCSSHLSFPPYLFGFISTPRPSSHRTTFPPALSLGFFFFWLSVILLGKVIKGRHIEGAVLRRVILFSHVRPLFCLLFVFAAADLIEGGTGRWGVRGVRDKPSMVLCGEIIWRADNARWVRSLQSLFSSPPTFLLEAGSPWRGLRVIQTHLTGCTSGKMSAATRNFHPFHTCHRTCLNPTEDDVGRARLRW